MLPRNQRVGRPVFPHLFQCGRRFNSQYFTLIAAPLANSQSCVSFVASKKVSGNATARHRAVRRGYGIINKLLPLFKKSAICVFYFKKNTAALSSKEIEYQLRLILNAAGLMD